MFNSATSFDRYPESSSSRNPSLVSSYPITSSFLDLSSSLDQTTPGAKLARSKKMLSSFEGKHRLALGVSKRKTSKAQVYATDNVGFDGSFASSCHGCHCNAMSSATISTTTLESVPESSLSESTDSSRRSSSDHVIGPVYDDLPKITPAYLRYLRAETKRSEEHLFGSVASRGTDISREERWGARMAELRRREEADNVAQEGEESEGTCERKRWFRTLVPHSHR